MPDAAAGTWIRQLGQRGAQPRGGLGDRAGRASDTDEMSDDGGAGMAHFSEINKA
jgi:hypothetical protein